MILRGFFLRIGRNEGFLQWPSPLARVLVKGPEARGELPVGPGEAEPFGLAGHRGGPCGPRFHVGTRIGPELAEEERTIVFSPPLRRLGEFALEYLDLLRRSDPR